MNDLGLIVADNYNSSERRTDLDARICYRKKPVDWSWPGVEDRCGRVGRQQKSSRVPAEERGNWGLTKSGTCGILLYFIY